MSRMAEVAAGAGKVVKGDKLGYKPNLKELGMGSGDEGMDGDDYGEEGEESMDEGSSSDVEDDIRGGSKGKS